MLLRFRGWLRALVRPAILEREMQEEMQLHLDRATERLMARGMTEEAARAAARREFGNVGYIQEEARDARGIRWIQDAMQDVRYAARKLLRDRGFAATSILTLAIGI